MTALTERRCTTCPAIFTPPPHLPAMSRCPGCMCGGARLRKLRAQAVGVAALPELGRLPDAIRFRMPGSPLSQNRAWRTMPGGTGMRKTEAAKEWQLEIARAAMISRPPSWPLDREYSVEIVCVFERRGADVDNPVKLVLDALQDRRAKVNGRWMKVADGAAYHNDTQVKRLQARSKVDAKAPRVEITVRIIQ